MTLRLEQELMLRKLDLMCSENIEKINTTDKTLVELKQAFIEREKFWVNQVKDFTTEYFKLQSLTANLMKEKICGKSNVETH